MANVMSIEKRNQILRLLVEGNSIRSICRLLGTNIPSVLRQMKWAGEHCKALMEWEFRDLTLSHLECDEIWTFVQKMIPTHELSVLCALRGKFVRRNNLRTAQRILTLITRMALPPIPKRLIWLSVLRRELQLSVVLMNG